MTPFRRVCLFSALATATACSSGPTTISAENAALGAALVRAGVLSGRVAGYAGLALSQIGKSNKLTLVSDGTGGTSQLNAVAVLIVWDLRDVGGQLEAGWYNGVVAWDGLSLTAQTVDHLVTAGAAGSGNVVQTTVTAQVGQLSGTTVGEALAWFKPGEVTYVGTSGTYTSASVSFGTPKSCARPPDAPAPVSCVLAVGTMTGSFTYGAQRFSGTGPETLAQPSVTFSLPAVQVIINSN